MFASIGKQTLILKRGGKKSFSYETKPTMSFISIRRMSLLGLIMKRKELLYEPIFVPIGKQTLIPKNYGIKSFSYETKASMSFISIRRMSSWCPILKRKEITV